MKKVIRLTESDLMRIVKRVINEQQQQSGDTYVSDVLKPYLGTNLTQDAVSLIQRANLNSTMSKNPNFNDLDIGASKVPSYIAQFVRDFQRMTPKSEKYKDTRDGIIKRASLPVVNSESIVFLPFNGGRQVGPYGARYIPSNSNKTQFILVPCTQKEPCRGTDL